MSDGIIQQVIRKYRNSILDYTNEQIEYDVAETIKQLQQELIAEIRKELGSRTCHEGAKNCAGCMVDKRWKELLIGEQ